MYKTITFLYLILLTAYIIFTRQPDYFDSDFAPATIHFQKDSSTQTVQPFALFALGNQPYKVNANYFLSNWKEGDKLEVIVDSAHPTKAKVYYWWGYWILWEEILYSIIIYVVLFFVAIGITNNPVENANEEDENMVKVKKRKYD